ncbi:hypothetical protein CFC21_085926 [Triticum aestivum]|uniref:AAA+ ATPase domain-containing protein n=2 Tax=Triticum aestivum TaxID=4565 RepID=A0A9R1L8Z1_WHEAT|nr:hypothetical protein CFC21_085926 [Triticum aestivum]
MEIVVGASEATMKSLLRKLGGLLAHEYALIRGVRGDIQYINDEMTSMQAFLGDLSSTIPQGHDRRMKDWMEQIRDVTYDIEDCVDDFAHRLSHDPSGEVCCAFVISKVYEFWTWQSRRDIASSIAELKVRAQQIGERRTRYGVDNPKSGGGESSAVATGGFQAAENQQMSLELVGTKKPVGVDKDIKDLGEWVTLQQPAATSPTDPSSSAPTSQTGPKKNGQGVLSIVGFGGVGKTTMAMALYQKFANQFDCRAMVTVSQSSDIEAILQSIHSQVMPQSKDANEKQGSSGVGTLEKNSLVAAIGSLWDTFKQKGHQDDEQPGGSTSDIARDLRKHLGEQSYLLLVDDVWSASMWEKIRNSLPKSKRGGSIILTTRFQAVASACIRDKGVHVQKVGVLRDDKPKELFMAESNMSEENQKKIPPELWEICGGLPLAIVTMAGHAVCNPDKLEKDWMEVCARLVPDPGKPLGQDGVTRILSHCYNDMPAEIKTCSLYLCIFPKGRNISTKRLTRRWLAEGFVSEKDGLSAEDVAETYFNHLIKRKIIRAVEHSSNGKVKSYQVHDMVLQYIVSRASEENFVTVVGGHWLMATPSNKVRRLSLQGGDSKYKKGMDGMNFSHVRSLTLFGSLTQLPSNSLKFGIVQVLDLEGCNDFKKQHAKEICKMLLLKYLSLRRTEIDKIPKKIGKLQYLETIDIRETNVTELPSTVCQLERLVNILGGNKRTRKALRLPEDLKKETMKSLRLLSGIEIDEGSAAAVADLHHLTELRKLAIYKLNIGNGSKLFRELSSSIEYLGGYSLHTLIIDDESSEFLKLLSALSFPPKFLNALELSGKLVELPQWITELDVLTKLTLSLTVLTTDTLLQLSKLKTLFSLTFSLTSAKVGSETAATTGENKAGGKIIVPASGFEELKLLRFSAPLVPLLTFPDNAMPKLERLELRFSNLGGMNGIENLQNLKEVHLRIHDKAGGVTKSMVENMATAAREDDKGPRIIVDQYHDRRSTHSDQGYTK